MRNVRVSAFALGLLFLIIAPVHTQEGPPKAPVREVTDEYFGQKIVDPYRWMEEAKSPELASWMKAQADYTRAHLDRLPLRAELRKRFEALNDTGVRVSGLQRAGNSYFYFRVAPAGALAAARLSGLEPSACRYRRVF